MLVAAVPVASRWTDRLLHRPLVLAYTLAVLASMVVALAVTPALGLLLSGERRDRAESPITRWLRRDTTVRCRTHCAVSGGLTLRSSRLCWPQ